MGRLLRIVTTRAMLDRPTAVRNLALFAPRGGDGRFAAACFFERTNLAQRAVRAPYKCIIIALANKLGGGQSRALSTVNDCNADFLRVANPVFRVKNAQREQRTTLHLCGYVSFVLERCFTRHRYLLSELRSGPPAVIAAQRCHAAILLAYRAVFRAAIARPRYSCGRKLPQVSPVTDTRLNWNIRATGREHLCRQLADRSISPCRNQTRLEFTI